MRLFLLALAVFAFSGCATIIHGTTQEVSFTSDPTSADVVIDGMKLGETPFTAELDRGDKHTVEIRLDGYEPYTMVLNKKVSGWVWGNLVFGGLIGLAVDAGTGALYNLTPEQVNAVLDDNRVAANTSEGGLVVAVVLKPNPEWERVGQLDAAR